MNRLKQNQPKIRRAWRGYWTSKPIGFFCPSFFRKEWVCSPLDYKTRLVREAAPPVNPAKVTP